MASPAPTLTVRDLALQDFGARLVEAWQGAGHKSRAAAAIAAQTTGGYFARLCAGQVEPGITIVSRLAGAFGVDAGWLAFGVCTKPARDSRARKVKP